MSSQQQPPAVGINLRNVIGITGCQACAGSGVVPTAPRVVFAESLTPMQIALLLASVCAPCEHCDGRGYVKDREIREQLSGLSPTD